jgi:S-(hydroxymethyl)glutathione dehydrogenase/alcohol dehydrogenase
VVVNDAGLRVGESLVVLGAGGVGLSVIQAGVLAGADPVVGVDLHAAKLELAATLGATHTVNASTEDVAAAVREATPGGADVVVDITGNVRLIEMAYELTAPQGRTILVGVPPIGERARLYTLPLHFGKVLRGSHGGETRPTQDIPRYARLVLTGKLPLDKLITNRYPLSDINVAIEDLREGRVTGRALIEIEPAT